MKISTREQLLAEADSLTRKNPFTREDSSKVENLIRLADAVGGGSASMEVKRIKMAMNEAEAGIRTPDSERLLQIDQEFRSYLFGGKEAIPIERRAQSLTTDASGGYLVPQPFRAVLEQSLKTYDQLFDVARRIESATGNATNIPIADDTAAAATQVAENTISVTSNTEVTFAAIAFGKTPTWRTGLVRGSREWTQDSGVDIESSLADLFALRIARGVGSSFVSTLLSSAALGVTAAAPTAATGDEILGLMASVDAGAAMRGSFLMNFSSLLNLWKLKGSSSGDYLIPASVDSAGYPTTTIFTKRVYLSPSMPSMTSGQKAIAFGDLSRFVRRDVVGSMGLNTYFERYAEYNQLAWEMFLRTDGGLLIPAASGSPPVVLSPIRYLKMA